MDFSVFSFSDGYGRGGVFFEFSTQYSSEEAVENDEHGFQVETILKLDGDEKVFDISTHQQDSYGSAGSFLGLVNRRGLQQGCRREFI